MGGNGILSVDLAVWSFVCGVLLCGIYDIFCVSRLIKKQKALILFINDFLFCIIAALVMLILFFNLSFGEPRMYAFLFAFLGFTLWRYTVSRFYIWLIRRAVEFMSNLLNSIKMRIIALVKRALRLIYSGFYCRQTIENSKKGFGLLKIQKLKRKENDYAEDKKD